MSFSDWALCLGGIGFLLLGMRMMTDGLKAAAGDSLRDILARSTRTRWHALLTGFSVTAVVQSSSAVIMTTLGFTNAGMLPMRKAAWLVFGSNVGTTLTAWIVAVIGLKLRIDIIALPFIGLGVLMHLFVRKGRFSHIGIAIAGFGMLFYGLGALRDAFDNIVEVLPIEQIAAAGGWGVLLGVIAGAVLTVLIQSSTASTAIILTAAVTGVFTPLVGASLIIGANLGTTSTSILASIGATANTRRLAMVHVTEKIFTGTIALILLYPMWQLTNYIVLQSGGTIATALALYHTLFNVLGVMLMWLFSERLFRFVERRIRQPELTSEKPRYLDNAALSSPAMGVGAMQSELKRVFKQLLRRGRRVVGLNDEEREEADDVNTSVLLNKIAEFADEMGNKNRLEGSSEVFFNLNWAVHELSELRVDLNDIRSRPPERVRQALSEDMLVLLEQLFSSGQLKALGNEQRSEIMDHLKEARRSRRRELLTAVEQGTLTPASVTDFLNTVALCEDSAKRVLRVAGILYPPESN